MKTGFVPPCGRFSRRNLLVNCGMGFAGVAINALLKRDLYAAETLPLPEAGAEWRPPDGKPHFPAKAKSVIWIFMQGGVSHLDTFDPKAELNKYAGMNMGDTPYQDVLNNPLVKLGVRQAAPGVRKLMRKIFPIQTSFRKYGQVGVEMTDWFPHFGTVVDDVAFIRSVWTTDNDHGAQYQFQTGRQQLDGIYPSIGSWVHYGLGTLNMNIPQFVVLGEQVGPACGGSDCTGGAYLGPQHAGVELKVDPEDPLDFGKPSGEISKQEQKQQFDFIHRLDETAALRYPDDPAIAARIQSYELAFRMQAAVPEIFHFQEEPQHVRTLYGLDQESTRVFGERCLAARRLIERGVRFVQIYHGGGQLSEWDAHSRLQENHSKLASQVDLPMAGLLKDLKQRGLLDETIVVWGTEFGRSPGVEGTQGGRDHHPYGFTAWMAGGGIRGGVIHGRTDELGFHAVENRHYVTDIHATVLHQLGLDPHRLDVPNAQKRLAIDYGEPIREILA